MSNAHDLDGSADVPAASTRSTVRRRLLGMGALPAVAAAALLLGACSSGPSVASPAPPEAPATPISDGVLAAPPAGGPALTYSPLTPAGATMQLQVTHGPTSTSATLTVQHLLPNRGYAAHAHTKPCGAKGADSGPHFQNRPDPAATPQKPSSDPAYANAVNEIWFDLHTDAAGNGTASTTVPYVTTPGHAPASVVIHDHAHTATTPGQAGTAGDRLACLTSDWA